MDSQGDTEGGAEDDAINEPQASIGMSTDIVQDAERAENKSAPGYLHESVIQSENHVANKNDAEEPNAEESRVETVNQQPERPRPTILDDHCETSRERKVLKLNSPAFDDRSFMDPNSSLDDLQRASQTWRNVTTIEAAQVPLPSSGASSVLSAGGVVEAPLPSGSSLEDLELSPENITLPSRNKVNPFISWIGGPAATIPKKKTKKKQAATAPLTTSVEVENYRNNVRRLASHFACFDNVASTDTRHAWCSRIVLYDRLEPEHHQPPRRSEPWPDQASAPSYPEFRSTLRTVADTCEQRVVLVEDLSPDLVDLLGATFDIPPHVFEEHLDRSGYKTTTETHKRAPTWNIRSSAQGYSSVIWYRPVLPLVPLTSKLRAELIKNQHLQVRCPLEGCRQHDIPLGTSGNIWRHYTELCSEPGGYYKGSETEYPVGWEEKATVWTKDYDGCKFVVVLLDPLPVVRVKQKVPGAWRHERLIPMGIHWIDKEEGGYRERRSRVPRTREPVDDWMDKLSFPVYAEGWPSVPAPTPAVHPGPTPASKSQPRTTGTDLDPMQANFTATALRRRATRSDREQVPPLAHDLDTPLPGHSNQETRNFDDRYAAAPPPPPPIELPSNPRPIPQELQPLPIQPPPPQSPSSKESDQISATVVGGHGPFVPYDLIKARASSSAHNDATFVTKHMHVYIESLQIPRSTLDEFDHFLQAPAKGKESQYDPFHALFRAIHDDSQSLVDIIRISLQQIREGTLDEDLMQKRVTFWRALLHRLSFNLGELEQSLRAFMQFINEPETLTSRALLPSQKLAENTRVTLRNCMGLIDRSSHSLLAEMQIVDSRKSIKEAESISKLTELAFVFIPLSFVASLFSMQVHELDGGVPLYQFALVAMGFVIVAYVVRLSIRSSQLIDYKNDTISQIREDIGLQHNDSIPTHKFLGWLGSALGAAVSRNTKNFISIFAPFTLIVAMLAAVLSPIVLLWLRSVDKVFTTVITMLLLLLDLILVISVLTQVSDGFKFKPQERIREIHRLHKLNRKRREKAKRRRRRTAGGDPEQADSDSTNSVSEYTLDKRAA